jgi:enediyne biosynthesis protein E4
MNRLSQLAVTLFFIGLFVTAHQLNKANVHTVDTSGIASKAASDALAKYGFSMEEISKKSGINFQHLAPKLDPKLAGILPRIADMGPGVAVGDFDRDGLPDVYLTNSGENSKNALYHNNGNGTFTDVAEKMGVADINRVSDNLADHTGVSMGAVWGDFDNDGYEDLLVYKWGKSALFHNDAGKGFTEVTAKANLPKWANINTGMWLDYDNDGKLDIYLGGYFNEKHDLWHLSSTRIMPDSLEYATNGTRRYLLKGNGDGTFTDVTKEVGMGESTSWNLGSTSADLNDDGFPEIILANDYGRAEIWENQGGKKFVNIAKSALEKDTPKSGMNASLGDVFNSGQFAIYISNIYEPAINLTQGNNLWVPKMGNAKGQLAYENMANALDVDRGDWSFGMQFGDLDNDGFLDIYLVNGYFSGDKAKTYSYSQTLLAGGNREIIQDVKNWPMMENASLAGYEAKHVWKSDGAGKFIEVSQPVGVTDRHDGRAVALGDLFNTGVLDAIAANQRGPVLIYKNTVSTGKSWIGLDLEGTKSNRSAIGANATVYWSNKGQSQKQRQVVSGGMGFCSQNDRRLHFGMGKEATLEKVEIHWPSGTIQTLSAAQLKLGTMNKIKEN